MKPLSEVLLKVPMKIIQMNESGGAFFVKQTAGSETLKVIVSHDYGWDHVSVSARFRCPTWDEMEFVKHVFFKDNETVMQLHVPSTDHISFAKYCLHMWRPQGVELPRPPDWMVGPKTGGDNP